jgi:galactonate dehydratase
MRVHPARGAARAQAAERDAQSETTWIQSVPRVSTLAGRSIMGGMRIVALDTVLANAGLRNYLFVKLTTDSGITGLGEASLEWQELAVQSLLHEWVRDRIVGADPYALEATVDAMIRDQYQGGSTIMTAISGVEIALWDVLGKSCGLPVYQLLGGRAREQLPSYANGWYGGASTPSAYAERAREALSRGFRALKFDPFGTAWKDLTGEQMAQAEALVAGVRAAVGDRVDLMIEGHGRLSPQSAIAMGRRLAPYRPAWFEEPVPPLALESLRAVRAALEVPITAGERLYTLEELDHAMAMGALDILNLDIAHCGGIHVARRAAAIALPKGLRLAPHCSIGPVALCAAIHFGWATSNVMVQEDFSSFDVPWRGELVRGWNLAERGSFALPTAPGLGIELDESACARHPYRRDAFPSLWDDRWTTNFTQDAPRATAARR